MDEYTPVIEDAIDEAIYRTTRECLELNGYSYLSREEKDILSEMYRILLDKLYEIKGGSLLCMTSS